MFKRAGETVQLNFQDCDGLIPPYQPDKMQIRAILEAAAECVAAGIDVHPQIKAPRACTKQELLRVKA